MTPHDRALLEDVIAACALCSEECCRIACEVLPVKPFHNQLNHQVFYWAAGQIENGTFDGVMNPFRLEELLPGFHEEDYWHPQMYDVKGFRVLCEQLRDAIEVDRLALALAKKLEGSKELRFVRNYFEEYARLAPPPSAERDKGGGIIGSFRR